MGFFHWRKIWLTIWHGECPLQPAKRIQRADAPGRKKTHLSCDSFHASDHSGHAKLRCQKKQKKTHFFFLLCAAWVKLRADWFAVSDLLHPDRKRICIDEKQIFDDICTKLTLSPTWISRAQRFWNSQSEVSAQLRSQHFFYQRTPIAKGSTSTQSKSDPLEGANLESPAWLNLRGKMSDFYLSNGC